MLIPKSIPYVSNTFTYHECFTYFSHHTWVNLIAYYLLFLLIVKVFYSFLFNICTFTYTTQLKKELNNE